MGGKMIPKTTKIQKQHKTKKKKSFEEHGPQISENENFHTTENTEIRKMEILQI